jgi:hypothetical protein
MSNNIHTFDETRAANNGQRGQNLLGSSANMQNLFSFPGMNSKEMEDPRNESFPYMLYVNFCPYLSFMSFTVMISILLTILFILQLALDGLTPGMASQFLQINDDGMMTGNFYNQYNALQGNKIILS